MTGSRRSRSPRPPVSARSRSDSTTTSSSGNAPWQLAVGQHDDVELRKRALAAGAERVYAYRKLFEDGPKTLGSWLTLAAPAR